MLNRATALLNFADADAQFQRRYCSISPAEALNFNAVCKYAQMLGNGYDKSHNFIVRNILGQPYVNLSAINRVVDRLTKNAGLPHITIHGFRHSVASILDENGVPIQDISVLLGHESVQTTEKIYINRRRTAKESTINTLGNAINLGIA